MVHSRLRRERQRCIRDSGDAEARVGWGVQDLAHWSVMGFYDGEASIGMDPRACDGNFLWSTGPNKEAGGDRDTACHIDIPMRDCTVMIDNETVVKDGKLVGES